MRDLPTIWRRLACLTFLAPVIAGTGVSAFAANTRVNQAQAAPVAGPMTPPAMCEAAIAAAETAASLPNRVLQSIALRESGRVDPDTGRGRPWPWTINYEGTGHYYASKAEAIAAVEAIQATGGQSIDVGCMQVNLMYHAAAFATLDEAFDPMRNAAYAGRFLRTLFTATGDWGSAIGGYHSRTPGRGEAYRDQVVATWNPKDPAVLARLTLPPAPITAMPVTTMPFMASPAVYVPFAQPGPIQIMPNLAYRAFAPTTVAYRSFRPMNAAYGDFNRKAPARQRVQALDLRLNLGNSGRGLVAPRGIVSPMNVKGEKPAAVKPATRRVKETG